MTFRYQSVMKVKIEKEKAITEKDKRRRKVERRKQTKKEEK